MEVEIPYCPRAGASEQFHARRQRRCVWIAHRRYGKTVAIANDALIRLAEVTIAGREHAPPRVAWMYPTRVRAKDIAWSYLRYYSARIPGVRHIESELAVEFRDGRRVTLYGADGHRGVGQYLDGIYYDECDDIPDRVIADIEPALSDYRGFSVFAGMLRGRHRLWRMREKTLADSDTLNLLVRSSESGVLPADELARLRLTMGESAFAMQMECNPNAAIAHAIYGQEMDAARKEGRVTRLAWDASVPVHWFADIGHSLSGDDWSWWGVQFQGRDILCQDYFSRTGELPAYYADQIAKRTTAAGCGLGWVYLPHDGGRKNQVGMSAHDYIRAAGIPRVKIVHRTPNRWDSINYLRALFRMLFVAEDRCSVETSMGTLPDGTPWVLPSGLDCLDYYAKKEPKDGEVEDEPCHDRYSHGADALRTMSEAHKLHMIDGSAMVSREATGRPNPPKVLRGAGPSLYAISTKPAHRRPNVLR